MKLSALLLAFLVDRASAEASSYRETVLEAWERSNSTTRSRRPVMKSKGDTTRMQNIPVDGTVSILQVVPGTEDRRARRNLKKTATDEIPYPPDGAVFAKTGASIHFKESTDMTDIECFVFDHKDPDHDFSVCESPGFTLDVVDGIADIQLTGFELGVYTWWVEDSFGTKSSPQSFEIKTPSEVNPSEVVRLSAGVQKSGVQELVGEAEWEMGGDILGASGRIYYSSYGIDYACTGTVMKDNKSGRTLIVTAAHCVWDDIDEVFGSYAVFIPNRDSIQTTLTADEIHRQCTEDVCGCWTMSAGVVHDKWRDLPWPDRLAYDYGVWIVDDVGAHEGAFCGSEALDKAVNEFEWEVGVDLESEYLHAMGYSLEHNPDFRYCADMAEFNQPVDGTDTYWLPECGLTGGASGGPWISGMTSEGRGKIVSVNSWSYSDIPGLGGPIIDESAARCLVNAAREVDFAAIQAQPEGEQGIFVNCYDRPCIPAEEADARRLRGDSLTGRVLCERTKEHKN